MKIHIDLWIKIVILAALAILACAEKLFAIMNLVAVERDWVMPPIRSLMSPMLMSS